VVTPGAAAVIDAVASGNTHVPDIREAAGIVKSFVGGQEMSTAGL
jgi:hypothetical protein